MSLRRLQRSKPELRIQPMRIPRHQAPAAEILKGWMLHDTFHQPLPDPLLAMRLEHEHITDVGVSGEIRNYPRKADLLMLFVHSEAQRVLYRPRHNFPGYALRPIAFGQKFVDDIQVQPLAISADEELTLTVLVRVNRCMRGHASF